MMCHKINRQSKTVFYETAYSSHGRIHPFDNMAQTQLQSSFGTVTVQFWCSCSLQYPTIEKKHPAHYRVDGRFPRTTRGVMQNIQPHAWPKAPRTTRVERGGRSPPQANGPPRSTRMVHGAFGPRVWLYVLHYPACGPRDSAIHAVPRDCYFSIVGYCTDLGTGGEMGGNFPP